MKKIKAIGFDFDGTLIMSENEKIKIFEEIFYRKYRIKKGVGRYYKFLAGKVYRIFHPTRKAFSGKFFGS